MSVRARLILAFLLLSVLPLTAVTLYSYGSSVAAFRAAVAGESGRMAQELTQRLDTVTADLGRQVGQVWGPDREPADADARTEPELPEQVRVVERIATMLGDSARLLDRVEFTPMPGRSPRAQPHPEPPPAPASAPAAAVAPVAPVPGVPGVPPPPPTPPRIVIDMREVMKDIEKEAAVEGMSPQ